MENGIICFFKNNFNEGGEMLKKKINELENEKNKKSSKGITLVALVITIIVLLILTTVTIQEINGKGIISYAIKASFYQEMSALEE